MPLYLVPDFTIACSENWTKKLRTGINSAFASIKQVFKINFESFGNTENKLDGGVTFAALKLAQVRVIHSSLDGKLFLGPTLSLTPLTNALSDVTDELIFWLHAANV